MARLVGVDIGGTNTDMVLVDTDSGQLRTAKVPSTLQNQPAIGLMNGLEALGVTADTVQLITHGTTVATNFWTIERKGARCGLIMTQGSATCSNCGDATGRTPMVCWAPSVR